MKKTWMPVVAGALEILAGVIGLVGVLGIAIATAFIHQVWFFTGFHYWAPVNVIALLWIIGVPMAVCAVLSLVGGIYAIQRKKWPLALVGSIAAFFPQGILGMAAIVLVTLSRDEFEPERQPARAPAGETA